MKGSQNVHDLLENARLHNFPSLTNEKQIQTVFEHIFLTVFFHRDLKCLELRTKVSISSHLIAFCVKQLRCFILFAFF